jgi:pimeloyl-ACP methyl ester carboxylesterase
LQFGKIRAVNDAQAGCAQARRRSLSVNGLRLQALEWGTPGNPALCFLHGGSAHGHWFDAVAPAFADRFHVVSLDQRGHGESQWATPPAYGTEQFASDLLGVLDTLGWARAVVVGHSMGGHNAMAFAAWHPGRVRALVIADSRPAIPEERLRQMHRRGEHAPRRHPTLESAVASFRLLPRETVADPALLAHLARVGVVRNDGGWSYRFDPDCNRLRRPVDGWGLVERITAPTLVVRGELSPILPREMAERLRGAIRESTLVEIPGAYHHVVLDAPAAFTTVLEKFLLSLSS